MMDSARSLSVCITSKMGVIPLISMTHFWKMYTDFSGTTHMVQVRHVCKYLAEVRPDVQIPLEGRSIQSSTIDDLCNWSKSSLYHRANVKVSWHFLCLLLKPKRFSHVPFKIGGKQHRDSKPLRLCLHCKFRCNWSVGSRSSEDTGKGFSASLLGSLGTYSGC